MNKRTKEISPLPDISDGIEITTNKENLSSSTTFKVRENKLTNVPQLRYINMGMK